MKTAAELSQLDFIETGLFIDALTGGLCRRKILVVSGKWSTGKSTLLMQAVAAGQRQGLKCLWVDVEYSFEPRYAELLGIDLKKLGVIQNRVAEEIIDEATKEASSGKWDIIVLDSAGALNSRNQIEKAAGEKSIGIQASLMSKFVRDMVAICEWKKVAFVCLTHEFTDIMTGKIKASGGDKMNYHLSQHIRLKEKFGVAIKSGDKKVGKVIVAEMKKDKLRGMEGQEAEGQMLFGQGFRMELNLLDEAIRKGVITKEKNTYSVNGEKIGGISKLREWAGEHQDELKALL